mgnify:CR=1 FL=1
MLIKQIKKKNLLHGVINFIIKNGKKELAKFLFSSALIKASKKTKVGCQLLLVTIFKKLHSSIEVKTIKRRFKILNIPFFISSTRQLFLKLKLFFSAVKLNSNNISYSNKICFELISIFKSNKAKGIFLKNQNLNLALLNRANLHFR